jgi:predicted nucleic acid-binding Zn ribbon protein
MNAPKIVTTCRHCNAELSPEIHRSDRKFCSDRCKQADYRRRRKVKDNPIEALVRGNNADLIKEVARLYADNPGVTIADVTYGKGAFWRKTLHLNVTGSDLLTVPERPYDFRNLPYHDGSFDVVVLDPPYLVWPGNHMSDGRYPWCLL